jgi:hypothetical protein
VFHIERLLAEQGLKIFPVKFPVSSLSEFASIGNASPFRCLTKNPGVLVSFEVDVPADFHNNLIIVGKDITSYASMDEGVDSIHLDIEIS